MTNDELRERQIILDKLVTVIVVFIVGVFVFLKWRYLHNG